MALDVIFKIGKITLHLLGMRWANSMQMNAFRRKHIIRWAGVFPICFYIFIGVVEAGSNYDREFSTVDQSSIMQTIPGVSEMQCLHKCRRSAECKKTLYERGSTRERSHCHFLKDSTTLDINGNKRGILLKEMQSKNRF